MSNDPTSNPLWVSLPRPAGWYVAEAKRETQLMSKGGAIGLPTGFSTLDGSFRLRGGQLTVIAARTSMGKTSFALQVAMHNAMLLQQTWDDGCVLFFSAEMSGVELFQKMASVQSGINLQRGYAGLWSQRESDLFMQHLQDLDGIPLIINDLNVIRTDAMRDNIQMMKDAGRPVRMVVFDYIELGADDDKFKDHERIAQIVFRLKGIARAFDIPVLALSQINREIEKESRHRIPLMTNLAGSDAVGRTADKVLTMMIPQYYLSTGVSCACEYPQDSRDTAYISVQKDRFGKRGTIYRFGFNPTTACFTDIDNFDPRGRVVENLNVRSREETDAYWRNNPVVVTAPHTKGEPAHAAKETQPVAS